MIKTIKMNKIINRFNKLLFIIFLLVSPYFSHAQLNPTLIGDAQDSGDNCFVITPDLLSQVGGVWYDNPIDFDEDFTIFYQNNFGSNPNGADGMALVFKDNPEAEIGGEGGGLGFEGITPSLIVEFDTFQNGENGDPFFDHIAIQRDGDPNHNNPAINLAGPIVADPGNFNIANGTSYEKRLIGLPIRKRWRFFLIVN